MVYRIDRGHHGDVSLDGLKFALVIRSKPVMSDGDWVFACVVDEKANDAQRQALAGIASGKSGGPPQMIRDNLVSDFRGVEFRRIDFTADGLRRATEIPGILAFEIEGVASPQPLRRAPLYRQHRPPGQPPSRPGARQEDRSAGLRARPQPRRQGQQRPLRAVCLGGLTASGEPAQPTTAAPLLDLMLRQRVVIAAALGGLTALCWLYLFVAAADMRGDGRHGHAMPMEPKGAVDLVLLLAMWWVMMAGMMLPGAAPMILTFATINRRRRAHARLMRRRPCLPPAISWPGAASAWPRRSPQWGLERLALLSPMDMTTTSMRLGGLLFVAAGLYQLTPPQAGLPAGLPVAFRFRRQPLAGRRRWRPALWASATASTASAAAGS